MATPPSNPRMQSKRPRLSLQTKSTPYSPPQKSSRPSFAVNPSDPTAFNTLSNAYVTAIERSATLPQQPPQTAVEPLTAINTFQTLTLATPLTVDYRDFKTRVVTPYGATYPETPVSAISASSPITAMASTREEVVYPSAIMAATPPLSAAPIESPASSQVFTFSSADTVLNASACLTSTVAVTHSAKRTRSQACSPSTKTPRKKLLAASYSSPPPYAHPNSLHSILRNSPLPPRTAIPPISPRRQSQRLQEKALKRVEYNSPLTQDITTNRYTKSHIDLLLEEASPSPISPFGVSRTVTDIKNGSADASAVDLARAFNPNEIEDGGQTPGPMEDMARKLGKLGASSPLASSEDGGVRKKRKKEKRRRWVWTIGHDDDEECASGHADAASVDSAALARVQATTGTASAGATIVIKIPGERKELSINTAHCPSHRSIESSLQAEEIPTPSIEFVESASPPDSQDVDMSDAESVMTDLTETNPRSSQPTTYLGPSIGIGATDADTAKTPTGPRRLESEEASVCSFSDQRKRDTPIPELAETY